MAKYYVRCGKVKQVLARQSRERAAYDVVHFAARSGDGKCLPLNGLQPFGLVTTVSERGYEDTFPTCYPTHQILAKIGDGTAHAKGSHLESLMRK